MLQMFCCGQVLGVLPSICKFQWSGSSITGKNQFLHGSSMELEGLHLRSKTCPEHWAGDQMAWFCFHFGVTAWLMLSSAGGLDFTASALACTTGGPQASLLWVAQCLCAPQTPAREEGRRFSDDNGRSTVQDEGRVCDIATTRVRAAFLHQFLWRSVIAIRGRESILRCSEKEEVLFPRRWGSSSHCNIGWAVEIDRGLERLHHISLWSHQKPDLESSGDSSRYLPVMLEALGWISSTAYRSGMVAHSCTPSTWEQRQEDEKFSYPWCLVSQKSAWPMWGPTLVS